MSGDHRTPTCCVELADGRSLALDDVGDPGGPAVIYIHGTPDSRIARHPDDSLATALGIRLIAIDRPGFGWSPPHDAATPSTFGDDLGTVAEQLDLDDVAVLAWSAGAVWALGIAARQPALVRRALIVGGLVPAPAYDDPAVRAAAGEARLAVVEAAEEMGADLAAEMIAPMLVPDPPTLELALEHLDASHDATTKAELAAVAGSELLMAEAMLDAVRQGTAGLVRDMAVQLGDLDLDLGAVACPVEVVQGELDRTCPPEFGRWYAANVPHGHLRVVPGAGHALLLTHWSELLRSLV